MSVHLVKSMLWARFLESIESEPAFVEVDRAGR